MRTIEEVENPNIIVGLSPDFRPLTFAAVGRRVTFSFRSGGKFHPWDVVISISREVAREAGWAGESHAVIGVNRNPTLKELEIRHCPDTTYGARKIAQSGRNFFHIKMPYIKDLHGYVPEISRSSEVKIKIVDKTRLVLDFSGIKPTGLPQKREHKCKPRTNTSSSTTAPTPTAGCPTR